VGKGNLANGKEKACPAPYFLLAISALVVVVVIAHDVLNVVFLFISMSCNEK